MPAKSIRSKSKAIQLFGICPDLAGAIKPDGGILPAQICQATEQEAAWAEVHCSGP